MEREERRQIDAWMVRLADGDRSAFEPLFVALWPILRRFAERSLGPGPDAEDAAQTALLKVFARANELDVDRDALTWVIGIVAFECRTVRARTRRRRELPDSESALYAVRTDVESPEESVIRCDIEEAFAIVSKSLRPADTETLRLVLTGQRVKGPSFRKRVERMITRLRNTWRSKHDVD